MQRSLEDLDVAMQSLRQAVQTVDAHHHSATTSNLISMVMDGIDRNLELMEGAKRTVQQQSLNSPSDGELDCSEKSDSDENEDDVLVENNSEKAIDDKESTVPHVISVGCEVAIFVPRKKRQSGCLRPTAPKLYRGEVTSVRKHDYVVIWEDGVKQNMREEDIQFSRSLFLTLFTLDWTDPFFGVFCDEVASYFKKSPEDARETVFRGWVMKQRLLPGNERRYLVVYEDGDCEEYDSDDLQRGMKLATNLWLARKKRMLKSKLAEKNGV